MAAVAVELLGAHLLVHLNGKGQVFPFPVAARHGFHVLIAHGLQHLTREQRAHAARAVGDDGRRPVGNDLFDLEL